TTPVSGRPAKTPQAGRFEREVGQTRAVAARECLRIGIEIETATLHQCNAQRRAGEPERDRDARGARTDDAQVGRDLPAVRNPASIDLHAGSLPLAPNWGEVIFCLRRGRAVPANVMICNPASWKPDEAHIMVCCNPRQTRPVYHVLPGKHRDTCATIRTSACAPA